MQVVNLLVLLPGEGVGKVLCELVYSALFEAKDLCKHKSSALLSLKVHIDIICST